MLWRCFSILVSCKHHHQDSPDTPLQHQMIRIHQHLINQSRVLRILIIFEAFFGSLQLNDEIHHHSSAVYCSHIRSCCMMPTGFWGDKKLGVSKHRNKEVFIGGLGPWNMFKKKHWRAIQGVLKIISIQKTIVFIVFEKLQTADSGFCGNCLCAWSFKAETKELVGQKLIIPPNMICMNTIPSAIGCESP